MFIPKAKRFFFSLLLLFCCSTITSFAQKDSTHFVFTIEVGTPNNGNYDFTVGGYWGYSYNFDIDWNNDGVFDVLGVSRSARHTYSTSGKHSIRLRGRFPKLSFIRYERSIVGIEQWGTNNWQSLDNLFEGCINLSIYNATDAPKLDSVKSMVALFKDASSFNGDIGNWDVSKIENMRDLFMGASAFNQNINDWNVSAVTDMGNLFKDASSFNQALNRWDVSSVIKMDNMFWNASLFNKSIKNWDVDSIEDMSQMFKSAAAFNQDIGNWDVSSVKIHASNVYGGYCI